MNLEPKILYKDDNLTIYDNFLLSYEDENVRATNKIIPTSWNLHIISMLRHYQSVIKDLKS